MLCKIKFIFKYNYLLKIKYNIFRKKIKFLNENNQVLF